MSIPFERKKDLRMTEIIRRLLCSEGKGKGVSTETVYSVYGRVVCPPPRSGGDQQPQPQPLSHPQPLPQPPQPLPQPQPPPQPPQQKRMMIRIMIHR